MILSELETMRQVSLGASLARLNDGELGYLFHCWPHRHQPMVRTLRNRLAEVLNSDVPGFLVGIPRVLSPDNDSLPVSTSGCQRFWRQKTWQGLCSQVHEKRERTFGSGFTSYPDRHVPKDQWDEFRNLSAATWAGKDVILVGQPGDSGGEQLSMIHGAASVRCHPIPAKDAWREYDHILGELTRVPIRSYSRDDSGGTHESSSIILIAAGITGTVLAYDLHVAGYHAVDIGRLLLRLKLMEAQK
jgi:hypothetical protein